MTTDPPESSDPFRPPSQAAEQALERPAALRKWERAALEMYLRYRDRPISVTSVMLQMLPQLMLLGAVLLVAVLVVATVLDLNAPQVLYYFMAGFLLGYAALGFVINRRFALFWPVLRDCLDWPTVEKTLETGTAPLKPTPDASQAMPVTPLAEAVDQADGRH